MSSICPQCGSLLQHDAPRGLCAECPLKQGLSSRADSAASPYGGDPTQSVGFTPPLASVLAPKFAHLQLEVLELLGQGGMGAVYRARQKLLDRTVALKVLPPDSSKDPAFAERFMREARAMAKLTHPNIVWVFDFGVVEGFYYLIMEFVDGVNLRAAIHSHQVTCEQALAIVPQICDALQYAHEEGVVEVRDEIAGVIRSGVKDAAVSVQDILSIQLKRGWWKHQVLIQTDYLKVGEIPTMERGQIRLQVARNDLEIAERFVAAVEQSIHETATPAKPPRHRVFEMMRQLTSMPLSPTTPAQTSPEAAVRSRLRIPAIGLTVVGGMNLIAMVIALVATIGIVSAEVCCCCRRCWSRSWGSWPIGLWVLVALADRSVKLAFGDATARLRGSAEKKPGLATYGPVSPADMQVVQDRVRGPALGLTLVGLMNLAPLVLLGVAAAVSAFDGAAESPDAARVCQPSVACPCAARGPGRRGRGGERGPINVWLAGTGRPGYCCSRHLCLVVAPCSPAHPTARTERIAVECTWWDDPPELRRRLGQSGG